MKPMISVIVSAYNAGSTLLRCLESLVYQSLKEIEILVVDKASQDNTAEIARLYQDNFPEKVRFFERPYSENLAAAYNYAIPLAKADYIMFCDADDWYELNAMELVYEKVQNGKADIILFPWYYLAPDLHRIRASRLPAEETAEAMLASSEMCTFWCRAYKRDYFQSFLPIPDMDGSDVSFLPVMITNTKYFDSVDIPIYNYVTDVGQSSVRCDPLHLSLIDGWDYLLANCNPAYVDYVVYFISRRVSTACRKFWPYQWNYRAWLLEHQELFIRNAVLQEDEKLYAAIMKLITEQPELIPQTIYLNGFGKGDMSARIEEIEKVAFVPGEHSVIVLDETNCDISSGVAAQAYKDKQYEYLGHYFSLKMIYETGGFYVGDQIRFTTTLAAARDKPSVFSFITTNTFSDAFFGALQGNEAIGELLETYSIRDFYDDPYYPLAARIRNVLVSRYDVPLDGKIAERPGKCFVADARMFVLNDDTYPYVCEHDFVSFADRHGYRVIPTDIALTASTIAEKNLRRERDLLRLELDDIYGSDTWKLMKRIKSFANCPVGRPFKSMFKKGLRIYRKHKYGM